MLKHRGFPGRLPGTDFQFTIRRANVKEGATKLVRRERFKDRKLAERQADQGFMAALWAYFGEETFERGNLDAGPSSRAGMMSVSAGLVHTLFKWNVIVDTEVKCILKNRIR